MAGCSVGRGHDPADQPMVLNWPVGCCGAGAPKAPLCKGSWHGEAVTEGLCSRIFYTCIMSGEYRKCSSTAVLLFHFFLLYGEGGELGCTFPHWTGQSFQCLLYSPSVSFADSSPYTGEPPSKTGTWLHSTGHSKTITWRAQKRYRADSGVTNGNHLRAALG